MPHRLGVEDGDQCIERHRCPMYCHPRLLAIERGCRALRSLQSQSEALSAIGGQYCGSERFRAYQGACVDSKFMALPTQVSQM